MSSIRSQLFGISLAFATAIGCIFYEKIVRHFSYITFIIIQFVEMICLMIVGYFIFPNELKQDYQKFSSDSKYVWWAVVYILTGISSLLWFVITKKQGMTTSSLYEVKYIVILALLYIFFGEEKFTYNTIIGILLTLCSIWFISRK